MQNSSWAHLLLELPLELAAVGARTNERWLRKRKRSHWWSKGPFPKVCSAVCFADGLCAIAAWVCGVLERVSSKASCDDAS